MRWIEQVRERKANRKRRALYRAVWELPLSARRAMLEALDDGELIVGAYADRWGRVCPMLAAHRRGARATVGRFPRAWDEFAGARRPRPATPRELEILRALLQESISAGESRRADPPPATAPAGQPSATPGSAPAPVDPPRASCARGASPFGRSPTGRD